MPKLIGSAYGRNGSYANRTGNKESGIATHARSSTTGVYVSAFEKDNGETEFRIYRTSGNDGSGRRQLMAVMTEDENYRVTFEVSEESQILNSGTPVKGPDDQPWKSIPRATKSVDKYFES